MQLVFFRLYLVLHACAARFDVTGTAQNFLESKPALIYLRFLAPPRVCMWEGEPDVLIKNPSASRLQCRTQWPAFRALKFEREYGKSGGVYIPVFTHFEQRFMVGKNSQGVWIEFFLFLFSY